MVACMAAPAWSGMSRARGMELVRAGRLEEAVEAFAEQARETGAPHDYYSAT